MVSLRAVLTTVDGLYLDPETGRRYCPDELLTSLPAEILDTRARVQKMGPGTYRLRLAGHQRAAFDVYSRRRVVRTASTGSTTLESPAHVPEILGLK